MTVPTNTLKISEIAADTRYAVVGGPFGSKLGQKDYIAEGVPVLRGSNLPFDKRIDLTDLVFVSAEKVERDLFGNLAYPGDIVVTQRGTLGQVGLIPEDTEFERFVVSQSQMKLTIDSTIADTRFVYYYLKSPRATKQLIDRASSSGVPHINLETFRNFDIALPGLDIQRSVANVLTIFDELIESNRRRIENLEEVARLLYRKWFVHFRFHGHEGVELVESDLGPIPVGWRPTCLGDEIELQRFNIRPFDYVDEEFDHYSIPAFDDRRLPLVEPGTEIKSGKYLLTGESVLVSKLNPRFPRVWRVDRSGLARRAVASTEFLVLANPARWTFAYVYGLVTSSGFADRLTATAGGTSTSHQRVKPNDVMNMGVVQPPSELVQMYSCQAQPMLRLADNLISQIEALREVRDLLLPRLVSGELDVSELEALEV